MSFFYPPNKESPEALCLGAFSISSHFRFFFGRPPSFPFSLAAADLAADLVRPASRARVETVIVLVIRLLHTGGADSRDD